jgi:hypothetical protein
MVFLRYVSRYYDGPMINTHKGLVMHNKRQRTRDKATRRLVVKLLNHDPPNASLNDTVLANKELATRWPFQNETYTSKHIGELLIQMLERLNVGN